MIIHTSRMAFNESFEGEGRGYVFYNEKIGEVY